MGTIPLRVCRITSAFPPPFIGLAPGPYQLSVAQAARGVDLTVIARAAEGSEETDRRASFRIVRIPASFDVEFSFKARAAAARMHAENPFSIIHGHGFSSIGVLAWPLRAPGVPVVTHFHIVRRAQRAVMERAFGGLAGQKRDWLEGPRQCWEDMQEWFVARRSAQLLAVSEGIRSELIEMWRVPAHAVWTVGNGVDTDRFVYREKIPRGDRPLKMIWVGKFSGRKGENDLLETAIILTGSGFKFRLSMVGEGAGRNVFQAEIIRRRLSQSVTVLPCVDFQEITGLYTEADIFIFPSRSEGMPKVALEAMACGCPVILSDIPGCRELVVHGKNGFLVSPGRPDLLAESVKRIDREPGLLQAMGRESRRMVEKMHTWDLVASKIDECYRLVLA